MFGLRFLKKLLNSFLGCLLLRYVLQAALPGSSPLLERKSTRQVEQGGSVLVCLAISVNEKFSNLSVPSASKMNPIIRACALIGF